MGVCPQTSDLLVLRCEIGIDDRLVILTSALVCSPPLRLAWPDPTRLV